MKQILCFSILIVFFHRVGICQQTVDIKLNQLLFEESFGELNEIWPVQTNNDNFFVFDDGEYFMNRTKKESPYAIISNWENDITSFRIRSSLMLGPVENTNQSIGIICRASKDGKSAIIFELNKFHKFRVRQLVEGRYQIVTEEGKDGWIKNNIIKGINEYNDIELRTNGIDHDIYINSQLLYSFSMQESWEGSFGLFIGPETKGRVDFFNVYADELYRDPSKIYLTEKEIKNLIKENEYLKIELEQSLDARAIELENALRILEKQLSSLDLINNQLDKENSQYALIKSAVDTNQVDLLLDLSHKIIESTLKNRQLKILNTILKDSLVNMKINFENLEIELFQKVIDKKIEEQHFIDSILIKYCVIDTTVYPLDSLLLDSIPFIDSLRIKVPELNAE
tara:strand:+ start:2104 stop:3294 length:1191 start_codon:yes stop_codon:yes gene_type:complete